MTEQMDALLWIIIALVMMLMDAYISPQSYALSFGLTALCNAGSLYLLRRKVKRVDMIESLKDNRE